MLNDLIDRVLAGKTDAFAGIVRMHQGMVTSFAAFRIPDADLVDEVVQQTFVRAYEQLREFDRNADFGAWLRTICHYFILTERKRALEDQRHLATYRARVWRHLMSAAEGRASDASSQTADRIALLRRCREELPEEARQLVAYRYDDECRIDAIAERVARPPGWVSTTLHRIRATLRACVERQMKAEAT